MTRKILARIKTIKYRTRTNKGQGFNLKIIFYPIHIGAIHRNWPFFYYTSSHEIHYNVSTLGNFKGAATTIERPLLAWVR